MTDALGDTAGLRKQDHQQDDHDQRAEPDADVHLALLSS
jgi:hypothetical protein